MFSELSYTKSGKLLLVIFFVVFLLIGLMLVPGLSPHGTKILNYMLALVILIYIVFFLLKNMLKKKQRGVALLLSVLELILLVIVFLSLIIGQFKVMRFGSVSQLLGAILWIRGAVEMAKAYFVRKVDDKAKGSTKQKSALVRYILHLLLISGGAYLFLTNPIDNTTMLWVLSILFFILCALCVILLVRGIMGESKRSEKGNE